mgnify:CR=1 FL=1
MESSRRLSEEIPLNNFVHHGEIVAYLADGRRHAGGIVSDTRRLSANFYRWRQITPHGRLDDADWRRALEMYAEAKMSADI